MRTNEGEVTGGSPLRQHHQTEGEQQKEAEGTTKADCSTIIQYVGGVVTERAAYVHVEIRKANFGFRACRSSRGGGKT